MGLPPPSTLSLGLYSDWLLLYAPAGIRHSETGGVKTMGRKQINMRMDEALIERIDEAAKRAGVDRTAFFEAAARSMLDDAGRAPLDLPRAGTEQRVQAVRSHVPGVRTAAEVRADPARQAAVERMRKMYGRD
jgi:hypothetical protein